MKKKLAMLAMVLTVGLNLCACGKKEVDNFSETAQSEESVTSKTSTETTEEKQSKETTQESFKVGSDFQIISKESESKAATEESESKAATEESESKIATKESEPKELTKGTEDTEKSEATKTSKENDTKKNSGTTSTESGKSNDTSNGSSSTGGSSGNAGGSLESSKIEHTTHTWDGGKVITAATCIAEGAKTYTCTVCSETKSESIGKTAHNFVTDTTSPTCTEAGKEKVYCSICGNVQSEKASGSPTGHNFHQEVWYEATCMKNGYYNNICGTCGYVEGVSVPPLEHDVQDIVVQQGDCLQSTIIKHVCKNCDNEIGSADSFTTDDHDWTEVEEFGEKYRQCARCGVRESI